MSNLIWNRVLLGSSFLGALSLAGFAPVAVAETITPTSLEAGNTLVQPSGASAEVNTVIAASTFNPAARDSGAVVDLRPNAAAEVDVAAVNLTPSDSAEIDGAEGVPVPSSTAVVNPPLILADQSISDLFDDIDQDSLARDELVPVEPEEAGALDYEETLGVVQSVDQLSDVSPTDWAYQALSQLIQNWNCIAWVPRWHL